MSKRLKAALSQPGIVRVFGVGQLCHPKVIEMFAGGGGYDAVWIDQEHAGLGIDAIEQAARAARGAGIDSFVRLAPTDYATVMRPLEAGAGGIMAAQVRSARQAEEIVRWAKFAPRGERGINGSGFDAGYGATPFAEYLAKTNDQTFIAIQIEHRDALEDVEKIAAVADVDVLFIGPADLSQSLGISGHWESPTFWQAVERVGKAAAAAKIHWGILPPSPAAARRCVDLGCKMLSLGLDTWAVLKGIRAFQKDYEDFFRSQK